MSICVVKISHGIIATITTIQTRGKKANINKTLKNKTVHMIQISIYSISCENYTKRKTQNQIKAYFETRKLSMSRENW